MTKSPQVRALDAMMANVDPAMVVVAAATKGHTAGCLVGFHTQSSIDPWRYTVCLSKLNHTYRVACRASHLAVHFLDRSHDSLARVFGGVTDDSLAVDAKLNHVPWQPGADGRTPILAGVAHWFLGRIVTRHHGDGDHGLFVVEPVDVADGTDLDDQPRYRFGQAQSIDPGHPAAG